MAAERSVPLYQGVPAGAVHRPGSVSHQVIPSMGALLAGFGMVPSGMFLPGRPPAPYAGANVPGAGWNGVATAAGQPRAAGGGNGERAAPPAPPQRGPWTGEEDDILKEMVREHGDRKWAVVARALPGRIGKQCRERWTNHLRPDIKKSHWTEEDDAALIQTHKIYGNRWSMIARFLPGRSENAVKNHWNATRRSLKAKRRLKKKKSAPASPPAGGQLSALEEYIRALYPADNPAGAEPAAPPVSPPSSYNLGYGEVDSSPPYGAAPAPPAGYDPAAGMGMMYLNDGAGSSSASSPTVPPLMLDLNASYYYGGEMTPPPPPPLHAMDIDQHHPHQHQHQQVAASYTNLMMGYPFMDSYMWQQSSNVHASTSSANAAAHQYYGAGGPSGGGGRDDVDVVQMASREFLMPSQDEVTLDLARFM